MREGNIIGILTPKMRQDTRDGLEGIVSASPPAISVTTSSNGFIVNVGDLQIASSILDRDYFVNDWFTEPQLYIIKKFDEFVQQSMKEAGTRRYSGLHAYSHIDRDVETAFRLAKRAGVPLDFITIIALLGHDLIEDDKEVAGLLSDWYGASVASEHETMKSLKKTLEETRIRKRDNIEQNLHRYASDTGAASNQKEELLKDMDHAVRIIYQVTRFPEERVYARSMQFQFSRIKNEAIENMLRRFMVKSCDRISNLEEVCPLYGPEVMGAVAGILDGTLLDNDAGKDFRNRLSHIRTDATEMPPSERVGNAFNSLFVLDFMNQSLNKYAAGIADGSYGARSKELIKLVEANKAEIIKATVGLLDSVISKYENDATITQRDRLKAEITDEIERFAQSGFYHMVTLDGFINKWLGYDAGGRNKTAALDISSETKAEVYRTARHLNYLIGMYAMFGKKDQIKRFRRDPLMSAPPDLMSAPDAYDPKRHDYFTLDKLNPFLQLMVGPEQVTGLLGRLRHQQPSSGQ